MYPLRFAAATAAAAFATMIAVRSHAQESPEQENTGEIADQDSASASHHRPQPGTHFIGELRLGSTVDGAGELAYGGALGVGGRWHGLPPIYLVGALDHTSATRGYSAQESFAFDESISLTQVGTGLRLYVPVYGPFRLMGEITIGALAVEARARDDGGEWVEDLWLPYTELAFGPQFRVMHQLSVGARAAFTFADTSSLDGAGPTAAWERALGRRTSVSGSVTMHF